MIDREIIVDLRKIVSTEGPFQTPTLSDEKKVYGTVKDAGAEEKQRAQMEGLVNVMRIDVNEEEFDGETIAIIDSQDKDIYKTVEKRNKVFLYLSDKKNAVS